MGNEETPAAMVCQYLLVSDQFIVAFGLLILEEKHSVSSTLSFKYELCCAKTENARSKRGKTRDRGGGHGEAQPPATHGAEL